jgi:ABC-type transport system substrate-binding protein
VLFRSDIVNLTKAQDPELDQVLDAVRGTIDPDERQQAVKEFQEYMVENAYVVSTLAPKIFWAMSNEVAGYTWAPPGGLVDTGMYLDGAYFVSK